MDMSTRTFRGNVSCLIIGGNTGESFQDARAHGADGSIAQAFGCSKLSAWLGDDSYESERLCAGRANGTYAPEYIGAEKNVLLQTGHDYEDAVLALHQQKLVEQRWKEAKMRHNGNIMSIRERCEVIIHPTPNEEYRNDAWPDCAAHIDCFIQVVKGEIILNPNFVIGGPEKNYKIIPAAEDHWYVGDAKTCQSHFSSNWQDWQEVDGNKIPSGGMKFGIAPTHYRQQMLGYLTILGPLKKFEGAMLLASKSDCLSEEGHAQVFIPYDEQAQTEGEWIMDEVSRKNRDSMNGILPDVTECKDVEKAISELPLMYPDVNKNKKMVELNKDKWKASFDRIKEIADEQAELSALVKPYIDEMRAKLKDELGITLGSISPEITRRIDENGTTRTIQSKKLKDEKDSILTLLLEDVQDAPSCYYVDEYTDETTGESRSDVYIVEYGSGSGGGVKWTTPTKAAIQEDYPEIFEDLKHRFPDRSPKLSVNKISESEIKRKKRR